MFLVESLAGGGAENVLSTIMRHIDKTKYVISVLAISGGGRYESEIIANVKYRCLLNHPDSYKGIMKLYYKLKYKLIYEWLPLWLVNMLFIPMNFDVEVAFIEGFATKLLTASRHKRIKKIAWVHVDLVQRPWTLKNGIFDGVEHESRVYQRYDKVVCVSKSVEKVMRETYGLTSTVTIYNPVDVLMIKKMSNACPAFEVDNSKFNIVSVGRMVQEKGYDKLLPIIKKLKNNHLDIHLWLIGSGIEEHNLKRTAVELGISSDVTFTGFLRNPYSLMSNMNLFVCSSRAEGFSLVIAESMVLGVPVLSMNCSGPNELIGDNKYGVLCDTYDELEMEIFNAVKGKQVLNGFPPIIDIDKAMKKVYEILD